MPPEVTDEIEDMVEDSSTPIEDAVVDEAKPAEEAASADPSPATDETEVDTLSIVRDVVGEQEEAAEAAPSAEGEEETGLGEDETTPDEEQSDDYSDVPFNQHPRFKQLITERNSLRGDAGEYRKITAFMDANALTAEEAANGVTIMGLAKLNPVEAFKQVAPWFKQLAIAAGEILPDELQQRVQKGELTRDIAFELSRTKAATAAQRVRQDFEQQRGQRMQQTEATQAVVTAAASWEQDRQLKDPNFAAKLPRIQEKLAFLHATGQKPTTPDGVRTQLKTVYEAVNREIGAAAASQTRQQRKPEKTPVRGGQVAGNARPAAPSGSRSTIDIINDVVSKRA